MGAVEVTYRLSDPVAAIFGLQIVEGVKIQIMNNASIGSCKIDTEAARFGRQQEDWDRIIVVKFVD